MLCRVPPKFFKEEKASRKTQRLCMGEYMMASASPLRVGTRLKTRLMLLSMHGFVTTKYGDGRQGR
jgi:hypothetical protein